MLNPTTETTCFGGVVVAAGEAVAVTVVREISLGYEQIWRMSGEVVDVRRMVTEGVLPSTSSSIGGKVHLSVAPESRIAKESAPNSTTVSFNDDEELAGDVISVVACKP